MAQINWTDQAIQDIQNIAAFIENDSPTYANRVVENIKKMGEIAATQPLMGRIVPEYHSPTHREVFAGNFRIMYQILGNDIYVTTVIHGARDFKV